MRVPLIRSAIVVALAASLTACALSEGDAGDMIYLHNTTGTPLTVTHEIGVSGGPTAVWTVGDVDPGQQGYFAKADLDAQRRRRRVRPGYSQIVTQPGPYCFLVQRASGSPLRSSTPFS